MGIAACAQQSTTSVLKRQTDPTIGCQDNIEYLPFSRPGGGVAAGVDCVVVFAVGRAVKKN